MHFEDAARNPRDSAARFHRRTAVPSGLQIKLDDRVRGGECLFDIAIALLDMGHFGRMSGVIESHRRCIGTHDLGQRFDVEIDKVGGILRAVRIGREYRCDRLSDIAHTVGGKDRLAIGIEPLDFGQPEIDRRHACDIAGGPDRDNAGNLAGSGNVDGANTAMSVGGTHHAHMQLPGEINVAGKAAIAGDQRLIFKAGNGAADKSHRVHVLPDCECAAYIPVPQCLGANPL